jgi:hypothetical protein
MKSKNKENHPSTKLPRLCDDDIVNVYNFFFNYAIVANIARDVAGLTRGPGRNLMFGSTYWILLGVVGRGG